MTMGQVLCDLAIDLCIGIPISSKHNSICDAMKEIETSYPNLSDEFYYRLMTSPQDESGWVEYLKGAAWSEAFKLVFGHPGFHEFYSYDDIEHGVNFWYSWYIHEHQYLECDSGYFGYGYEFLTVLRDTQSVIAAIICKICLRSDWVWHEAL
jgi:hypothetical protein